MTDVHNPVEVEREIRRVSGLIGKGVRICSDRYDEFLRADRDYDRAYARSYLEAGGAAHERKYIAELATTEERELRDRADVAYRYADRAAKALENELRAWQSVGASVRQMYAVAGRGEGY